MNAWDRAYERLASTTSPHSLSQWFRLRRWEQFAAAFPDAGTMRVLDLGGTVSSWIASPVRPRHVSLVNVELERTGTPEWIDQMQGDACDLPDDIGRGRWDLVFSNSVIEHVGGHARREMFARTVCALAPAYWVQTPYRYFPVEPHWLFPGFQFLSTPLQARADLHWPLKKDHPHEYRAAVAHVQRVELLNRTQLSYYFPDSAILTERLLGLSKSIIAVRTG